MYLEGLDCTITKFIELYGDRTGQKGTGVHGGLAWIGDEKFVLLAWGGEGAADAADWRRMSRLAALAQHLRRPVLLWDMPLQVVATVSQKQPLVINEAIQDCKLALLRMRVPVISVFKERFPVVLTPEIAMVDGAVIVSDHPELLASIAEDLPAITMAGNGKHNLTQEILALIERVSRIGGADLERRRVEQIRKITMQRD